MRLEHRARIFKRLYVTFTLQLLPDGTTPTGMNVEWDPGRPEVTPRLLKRYMEERHKFLEQVSEVLGGPVAVVDL